MASIYFENGDIFCQHVRIADSFFKRFAGLMFTQPLPISHGLLIQPCNQVHSHFMRYPIDVVFLDDTFTVKYVLINMRPWRFSKLIKGAQYVLEVPAHYAKDIQVGQQLKLGYE